MFEEELFIILIISVVGILAALILLFIICPDIYKSQDKKENASGTLGNSSTTGHSMSNRERQRILDEEETEEFFDRNYNGRCDFLED